MHAVDSLTRTCDEGRGQVKMCRRKGSFSVYLFAEEMRSFLLCLYLAELQRTLVISSLIHCLLSFHNPHRTNFEPTKDGTSRPGISCWISNLALQPVQ